MQNQNTAIDAILPAGGRIEGEFARQAGSDIKALIRLNGATLLHRTVQTLRETGRVRRIVVIGPEAVQKEAHEAGADGTIAEGESGTENIYRGAAWLQEQNSAASRLVVAATDLPFLTANGLTRYLAACPPDADVTVPVITQAAFEAEYPGSGSVFVPLRPEPVTIGCVFLLNAVVLPNVRPRLEQFFALRKSQIGMARMLGAAFTVRYLLHRLTVPDIEAQCRRLLHCNGVAVAGSPPELAFDIDLPAEFEYALAHSAAPLSHS